MRSRTCFVRTIVLGALASNNQTEVLRWARSPTAPEWPTGGLRRASGPRHRNELSKAQSGGRRPSVSHSGGVRRLAPNKFRNSAVFGTAKR